MTLNELEKLLVDSVEDLKAFDINVIDVQGRSGITDLLVFASGRSDRQVKSIANSVVENCKKQGIQPIGVEGMNTGEWVLVDLGDAVVHVMLPQVRDFYNIERIWDVDASSEQSTSAEEDASAASS